MASKRPLTDADLAALARAFAARYRQVSQHAEHQQASDLERLCADAWVDLDFLRIRARVSNVRYWLVQAQRSAYALESDLSAGHSRPIADFAGVLYHLSMARHDLRAHQS